MTPIDRYRLASHAGPYESWPLTSTLIVDGHAIETQVPGFVIEAQYEFALGVLLITSFDCPFEESNAFILLNEANTVVAKTELVIPYSSFLLHAHWPVDAHTLVLHYYQYIFYTLSIRERGMFRTTPKLQLRAKRTWRGDVRMAQSYANLQAVLAQIEDARSTH